MSDWKEIERNRRLVENESGTIVKDWGGKLPLALVYANTYSVGMASLGYQTLYGRLNARPDVACERAFDDGRWDDSPPPLSLESGRRLDAFPVIAFSLSFELDYLNAVNLLRRCEMSSLRAAERDDADPILLAGGPAVSANPLPLAPIFDAVVIGEAEEVLDPLVDALQAGLGERSRLLRRLADIQGVYVPAVHGRETPVRRRWVRDISRFPTRSVLWTPEAEFGLMHLVEITRGCGRGCRFCLAGYTTRPWRQQKLDVVLDMVDEAPPHVRRVGLVGAAVSDYDEIDALAGALMRRGVEISVSSLRADSVSPALLDALAESGTQTVTVAPEAGSQRLRAAIGKGIREEDIFRVVEMAGQRRFHQLKLYFMLGLPTEDEEDVDQLISLVERVASRFPRQVVVNIAPFVPKAHTPFQWMEAPAPAVVKGRLRRVERVLRRQGVEMRADSPEWAEVQALLARGDERLADVLTVLRRPTLSEWRAALMEAGLKGEEYRGPFPADAPLPWECIDSGVSRQFLERQAQGAGQGRLPAPCPGHDCTACGVC